MKKKFKISERVRIRKTLMYGTVKSFFSDTEIYVLFDGEEKERKCNPNDLAYGIFKQLREWWKDLDNMTDEELISLIERAYDERYSSSLNTWKNAFIAVVFFALMVWIISIIY